MVVATVAVVVATVVPPMVVAPMTVVVAAMMASVMVAPMTVVVAGFGQCGGVAEHHEYSGEHSEANL